VSTQKAQTTVEAIADLTWVDYIAEVTGPFSRDDATHRIETSTSELRMTHEIHTLQNLGATVVAFSATPEHGGRLYVNIGQ